MPSYDFECLSCGEKYSIFASWRAKNEQAVCPKCRSTEKKEVFAEYRIGSKTQASNRGNTCQPSFRGG